MDSQTGRLRQPLDRILVCAVGSQLLIELANLVSINCDSSKIIFSNRR
jgi:hypothetical protein